VTGCGTFSSFEVSVSPRQYPSSVWIFSRSTSGRRKPSDLAILDQALERQAASWPMTRQHVLLISRRALAPGIDDDQRRGRGINASAV